MSEFPLAGPRRGTASRTTYPRAPVAVVGGGSIGVAFALVFAKAGHSVTIMDADPQRREAIPHELRAKLELLSASGLTAEEPDRIIRRVGITSTVREALSGAILVQECVPERLDVKRRIFSELGDLTAPECILASSSSAIPASRIAAEMDCDDRIIVAHPGNPPFLLPIIELVPTENTRSDILEKSRALYAGAGMSPVIVEREVEGFLFNRLQGAVLREAYALVRDGVATVEDIDTVMRDGLGRRWSFMGPFETVDLNTHGGISAHAEKMGPAYERMGAERGQHDPWTPDLVAEVNRQRRSVLALEDWEDRVAWRDRRLIDLITAISGTATPSTQEREHESTER
ncbi:3-hydroxyacyl-CoA dehydrogenase [Arthrobacter castelli]|uniref:3-hydroxyacyl-CoA dehydrogenase n=1 Tax=Arthrobacter castelli TaxID=271431 RepID=UPI0009D65F82|nr:3-hydroxyacyl-CoA dehydrogenase [Arthrobacter castelli]